MSLPERPAVGQVVTVFRNRLRPEHEDAYRDELAVVADLAASMPGFVETKTFVADDGERCTVVTFADAASHAGWRDHPRHREAQRHGVADYYAEYSIAVGETSYASSHVHPGD
ncbi:antibiotic biosynthesis monooxygenase [Phycicoccus sp. BSK3Z-2]|uniref:Antibiotic biosynthesis monooxygenase n=1 Tax=Phycicoccus avicenniae TaxID=2828860 RepID=A0A941D6B7_9MICO|nr:antibiotic biosynthesis monooxygenase [Phycicoccus avicenniae]MBR7742453.1 antibiotic biosynthesis monooxygenase [Phycicoccus avicenniae]